LSWRLRPAGIFSTRKRISTQGDYSYKQAYYEDNRDTCAAQQGHCRLKRVAHESGIHQDGLLKEKMTYEIMKPEDVGLHKTELVLGSIQEGMPLRQGLVNSAMNLLLMK